MYNGIGLQTPRGSGTNGYIQSNKFFVKPKTNKVLTGSNAGGYDAGNGIGGFTRKPNKDILDHDRKRQMELKLVVLEDKLIDQGYTDAEIAEKLDEARRTLEAALASEDEGGASAIVVHSNQRFSDTQTHQVAARKEKQMETLKNALGIVHEDNKKDNGPFSDDGESDDGDKERNNEKNDPEFVRKPEKGTKGGKDGLDALKQYKQKTSKRSGHEDSSNSDSDDDSDSSRDLVKRTEKRRQKSRGRSDHESESESESDSDSDVDMRKKRAKSSKKYNKGRRHDSDDSDHGKKRVQNLKASKLDDSSSSDESLGRKRGKVKQLSSRSRRHDSDNDSDDSNEGRGMEERSTQKRNVSKIEKIILFRVIIEEALMIGGMEVVTSMAC